MSAVVQVTRTLKASPQDVYNAWTDADRLAQWLCPDPGIVAEAFCDPVVGGRFRIVKIFDTGVDEVTGEYLVVEAPHRLVFTWTAGSTDGRPTEVTVTFHPDGDTTEMTITHQQLPSRNIRDGAAASWADVTDKLDRYLSSLG
jgi:uncharacterized protein YndB with AHSA1/START domain